MCGIAGMRRFDGGPARADVLEAMASTLVHRGPDGQGLLLRGPVGLAHRRLAIIDVAGSAQPMSSPDGGLHVCFNGEILNYRELRARTPYPYRTAGDTEVLLALHARRGPAGVDGLVGQFSYALFDEARGDLWLHRDRLGILPLYYYADDDVFLFASEIKAILAALDRTPSLDVASVADYLAQRSVPAPWTLWEGIRALEPGCSLRVHGAGVDPPRRYWTLPVAGGQRRLDPAAAVGLLDRALTTAVERCLVADVPVGAYLSGGLDSSLVVALMSRLRPDVPVQTFSAGFGDPRHDELPAAREVSRLFGTVHHEVRLNPDDFAELWEPLTWHRDAPVSEASDVAVHRLARSASGHVKVVLSGEGSDELFGGYPKHRYATLTRAAGVVPYRLRNPLLTAVERSLPAGLSRPRIAVRAMTQRTQTDRVEAWFASFLAEERADLLGGPRGHRREAAFPAGTDSLTRMLAVDLSGWLPGNLLERGDRMSMAASVELRPPFLDVDVVDLAFALPSRLKVRGGTGKWLVRELARRLLPPEVVDRRKVGFRVPLDTWFRTGLREMAWDRLTDRDALASELFDRRAVAALLRGHETGRRNEELRIWTLLALEARHETGRRNEELRIWTLLALEVWHAVCRRRAPAPVAAGGAVPRAGGDR